METKRTYIIFMTNLFIALLFFSLFQVSYFPIKYTQTRHLYTFQGLSLPGVAARSLQEYMYVCLVIMISLLLNWPSEYYKFDPTESSFNRAFNLI